MNLLHPWWLLLFPMILLPIWWHRQKQKSHHQDILATAKFLPATSPVLLRIWRWRECLLLLLRCLLLLVLILLLVRLVVPRYGDTVIIDQGFKTKEEMLWIEKQIQSLHLKSAPQMRFCTDAACPIQTKNLLTWLEANQAQWREKSRILVLAKDTNLSLPAQQPQWQGDLIIRTLFDQDKTERHVHHVTVRSKRFVDWQRLFAAYEGEVQHRYELSETPNSQAELIIWDDVAAAPKDWRAPLWWARSKANFTTLIESQNLVGVGKDGIWQQVETGQGRVWIINQLDAPLSDIELAKSLFHTWQKTRNDYVQFTSPSQDFLATDGVFTKLIRENTESELLLALCILFSLERLLTHARRR